MPGHTIPEERSVRRRYSVSSSEGSVGDLEASLASVRQTSFHAATFPRAGSSSKSPVGKARSLANKFNFMRDSVSSSQNDENVWTAKTDFAWDTRILFKRRITALYIQLTSLKSYVEINYSGFRKILKKLGALLLRSPHDTHALHYRYDKVTYSEVGLT